ncbi:hypothetical protein E2C01_038894 [Portunus trituberculatus]|uniref:Uncharacterized protein n=1 Tax=Portunus trituberculatus TaxID=210409 RepID=A0A5B7FFD4_PORTR|nr:hypothetical protein [Portunus trituberculatus]
MRYKLPRGGHSPHWHDAMFPPFDELAITASPPVIRNVMGVCRGSLYSVQYLRIKILRNT